MKRLFLLTIFAFPLLVNAQAKETSRICRILFLNAPADAPKKLFLFDGSKSQEVDLPGMQLSDPIEIPTGSVVLYLTPDPISKPAQIPLDAPSGELPAAYGDCYMIVTSNPENSVAPVELNILDAGKQKFKNGQMLWYNLTSSKVSGQLGKRTLELDANSQAIVDEPIKENGPFDVDLSYVSESDTAPHSLTQTKWTHDPRSRMVIFVHAATENGVPQITGAQDFRKSH